MSRLNGRKGRVYLALTSGGTAEPLTFIAQWTLNQTTAKNDVTAMDDSNKVYVSDLPDASGTFRGFYDDATVQTYTAATDGLARKFYLYPSLLTNTQYWFGTILPDFSIDGGVGQSVNLAVTWNAASQIQKVG